MELYLARKRALVTGASRGIGAAVAHGLAEEGCHLDLVARDRGALEQLKAAILERIGSEKAGSLDIRLHAMDMQQADAPEHLAEAVGPVDILVNNAGGVPHGTLLDIDDARWRAAWDVKIFGYINLTREIYRRMIGQGTGVIVNIVGTAAERPQGRKIATASGNAALVAFTKALGGESVAHGIRVVAINPGATETDRQIVRWKARAAQQLGDENRWRELTTSFPFGRMARPDEIASVVTFVASERASYVSGTVITIDAGGDS